MGACLITLAEFTDYPMIDPPENHTAKLSDDRTIQPFDATVQEGLSLAREYALVQGYLEVRSVHLVVGMISVRTDLMKAALADCGLSAERLGLALLRMIRPKEFPAGSLPAVGWSTSTRRILEHAIVLAQSEGVVCVNEHHVWRSIFQETQRGIFEALDTLGIVEAIASRLESK